MARLPSLYFAQSGGEAAVDHRASSLLDGALVRWVPDRVLLGLLGCAFEDLGDVLRFGGGRDRLEPPVAEFTDLAGPEPVVLAAVDGELAALQDGGRGDLELGHSQHLVLGAALLVADAFTHGVSPACLGARCCAG